MRFQRRFVAIELEDLVGVGFGPGAAKPIGDVASLFFPDLCGQFGEEALELICLVGLCPQNCDDGIRAERQAEGIRGGTQQGSPQLPDGLSRHARGLSVIDPDNRAGHRLGCGADQIEQR